MDAAAVLVSLETRCVATRAVANGALSAPEAKDSVLMYTTTCPVLVDRAGKAPQWQRAARAQLVKEANITRGFADALAVSQSIAALSMKSTTFIL
jgi:cobalamin biosynthesis protein CobT